MKKANLKIFIIAGEVSGDVLGAKIMNALQVGRVCPGGVGLSQTDLSKATLGQGRPTTVEFAGIGGANMRAMGLKSLFPISDLSVMGLFEVIAHARTLTRRINETAAAIIKYKPDIVLTVDSPSFATRVVKKCRGAWKRAQVGRPGSGRRGAQGLRALPNFYHVVAPMVWAWGPWRAKKYAKIFDRLYCFFDFERPYFEKYGLKTIAVGHPIADGLKPVGARRDAPRAAFPGVPAKSKISWGGPPPLQNIALIPGSRMSEVKRLLPVLKQVADEIPLRFSEGVDANEVRGRGSDNYQFYIPVVETTAKYARKQTKDWEIRPVIVPAEKRYDLYAKTDIAIAASGTVSAELAIMHIPAIVVYKMNPVTTFLARIMLKTKWASLVNILLRKTVYPELLGGQANAENIMREFKKLETAGARAKMISELAAADKMWRRDGKSPAKLIADDIVNRES